MGTLIQTTGTRWDDGRLRLHTSAGTLPVEGPLHWTVGERTCIGYWSDGWQPCPDRAPVGHDQQCLLCFRGRGDPERRDDQPACIFEPMCKGAPERCVCSFGGARKPVSHVVYCAFYGGLPKVGMTMERRVETRLTEQGADAYFVIETTADRQSARALEKQVAFLYGLPEWRRHAEVFPQLTKPVDRARIEAAAQQWHQDLSERYAPGPLHHVDHRLQPLPSRPTRVPVEGEHQGTWLGAKGAHLFYQGPSGMFGDGPVLALKRGDLVGHWVDVQ